MPLAFHPAGLWDMPGTSRAMAGLMAPGTHHAIILFFDQYMTLANLVYAGAALNSATAQPAAVQVVNKVLLENDKVTVIERLYAPGAVNASPDARTHARVIRAIKGGTLMRTYPDGKTEKVEYKTGQVRFNPAATDAGSVYTTKNVGKSEMVLYLVELK